MKRLRAAVVGVGAFGRHHARIYGELASEGVELVGLVDTATGGTPAEMAARLGVPLVASVDELPERPDICSVAVPTSDHRSVAEPLLAAGVHCLVEKPLAGSTADARALVGAAKRGGSLLHVGLVERFNPVLAALDRLGEPPVYIEVHRLAPYVLRAGDVGVVMDLMIHDLDILHHLVGGEVASVEAVGVSVASDHEDMVNARITFANGCVANVTSSRVADQRARRIQLYGRKASLLLDYDTREARLVRPSRRLSEWGARIASLASRGAGLPDAAAAAAAGTEGLVPALRTERIPIHDAEPLRREIRCLIEGARLGASPGVGGSEGLRALRTAEAILDQVQPGLGAACEAQDAAG